MSIFAAFEMTYQIELSCQFMKVRVLISKIILLTSTGLATMLLHSLIFEHREWNLLVIFMCRRLLYSVLTAILHFEERCAADEVTSALIPGNRFGIWHLGDIGHDVLCNPQSGQSQNSWRRLFKGMPSSRCV